MNLQCYSTIMSAPTVRSPRMPWGTSREVTVFFTASRRAARRRVDDIPQVDQVEVTATLLAPRKAGQLAIYTYENDDRIDITAREELGVNCDPGATALRAITQATGLAFRRPRAVRPYVRVDYDESGDTSTLVLPYIFKANFTGAPRFPLPLTAYDFEELKAAYQRALFADKGGDAFHPTIVHDATLAVETLK